MKQCKSCRTRALAEADICPVCGIDQDKAKTSLTTEEKRVRRVALNIRFLAILHLILAGIGIMALPDIPMPTGVVVALSILSAILAIGLIRYAFWAYRVSVVCYFALGIVNIIAVNLPAIPVILLLLYVVGNKTAKAIFERQLPTSQ